MRARIILPAAAVLALAATLALWITKPSSDGGSDELDAPPEAQPDETTVSSDAVDRRAESEPEAGSLAQGHGGDPAGTLPAAQLEQPAEPFDPATREHATVMILHSAREAMEAGDLKQLHELMELRSQHRREGLISDADQGAVEAAIACLENAPDADQEARDFLRYGGKTVLADGLQKACGTH